MALLSEGRGYGQIEPNHLSGQRNGQIYAQLPCVDTITELQNGQFVKYDYAKNQVNYNGDGEWMLVYNEVKLYDPRHTYKDFVYRAKDFSDGKMYPRVFKTMPGDIFTTNLVELGSRNLSTLVAGDKFVVDNAKGILKYEASPTANVMTWQVAKVYTMPDGSPAVKLQRIV
ncbi:MAG: hypothetical protein HUJ68_11920 [Clostridia bacterium]|nr:hypothetical protein [Clostridia bacterium]